jgi:hypothetical protein
MRLTGRPGRHPETLTSGLADFLRRPTRDTRATLLVCQIKSCKAYAMKHQRHFGTTASWEAVKTRTLVADLNRIVQIINEAIDVEEKRAGVFDPFQAEYPMHARELAARRDNLKDTVVALEQRFGHQK